MGEAETLGLYITSGKEYEKNK